MRVILGLDPGTQRTGYGILQIHHDQLVHLTHGVFHLGSKLALADRLYELTQQLEELLKKWQPGEVVVEKMFLGVNVDSAFKLGHARGICLAQAARFGCRLEELAPRAVKKAVTGYGAASKDQVALAIASWLRLDTTGVVHDATDALALATARALVAESAERLQQLMAENP
ncbi:MAG: crossover junction endodeoxyribonuclease RuvC [Bdellovibrionales bacterium]|nr:crossover junction endodeoxyribonuclease RuvC [Bdellovibrionales bacterium]